MQQYIQVDLAGHISGDINPIETRLAALQTEVLEKELAVSIILMMPRSICGGQLNMGAFHMTELQFRLRLFWAALRNFGHMH